MVSIGFEFWPPSLICSLASNVQLLILVIVLPQQPIQEFISPQNKSSIFDPKTQNRIKNLNTQQFQFMFHHHHHGNHHHYNNNNNNNVHRK